jgi:hypothetical protein
MHSNFLITPLAIWTKVSKCNFDYDWGRSHRALIQPPFPMKICKSLTKLFSFVKNRFSEISAQEFYALFSIMQFTGGASK